jgi:hypothetical protein
VLLLNQYFCFSHLFRHLRPELVREWRVPLNPDVFSNFVSKDNKENQEKHIKDIKEVSFLISIQFDHVLIHNIFVVCSALNT